MITTGLMSNKISMKVALIVCTCLTETLGHGKSNHGFITQSDYRGSPDNITPQVRLKMNDKKPSKFQFYFSGVLEAFSMLKKWKKKFASLDFGDNPIYPISNPDGQDQEV